MRPPIHVGCKVDGCDRKHAAKGFCNMHYKREYVYGGRGRTWRPFNPADRLEDCQWMAEHGESLSGAARRLGISRDALDTWLSNHDRDVLRVLRGNEPRMEESRATFHGVAS